MLKRFASCRKRPSCSDERPFAVVPAPYISLSSVIPLEWINRVRIIKLEVTSQLAGRPKKKCHRKLE